jgi:hypothetical protein
MKSMSVIHPTARETLLARIAVRPDVMARRWEPLSDATSAVVREWVSSGELSALLSEQDEDLAQLDSDSNSDSRRSADLSRSDE